MALPMVKAWRIDNLAICKRIWCGRNVFRSNHTRVRFAPSPTGMLHLGGLRTALYNYVFAKSQGGTFIIRIEDTDQTRLVPGAIEKLLDMLKWCGITPDEGPNCGEKYGPYIQSERMQLYQDCIKRLLKAEAAYCCFCTPKRLDLLRKDSLRRGETPKYDNRCRHLSQKDLDSQLSSNVPHVVRLKLSPGVDSHDDIVMGHYEYDVGLHEGDPVLLKSDKFPTYHLANVVDDHYMKISHVLRGVEWQQSTTKHLQLYKAFGWKPPQFGHFSLLLNSDGTKLSKRQGDIQVEHFKNLGYFPEAVLQFITNVGGGFIKTEDQGFSLEDLTKQFSLDVLSTASGRLEYERLDHCNRDILQARIKTGNTAKLITQVRQLVQDQYGSRFVASDLQDNILSDEYILNILSWSQDRIYKLSDLLAPDFEFLWCIPSSLHEQSLQECDALDAEQTLLTTCDHIKTLQSVHDRTNINTTLKTCAKSLNIPYSRYMQFLRAAISGLEKGPSVAEMISVLGLHNTLQRLHYARECICSR